MGKINWMVTGVTFGLFFGEALLHYNLGVHKDPLEGKKFVLPPTKDIAKLAGIVLAFSALNGIIINQISK